MLGHNYWHPNYCNVIFQDNSSEFSPIMPEEFGEHLIRDQRPFSSSRISPDPSDSQIHVSTSSLQFTSLIFYRVQVRGLKWPIAEAWFWCPVTHFCVVFEVCIWIIVRLEDPNMAHYKISNRVSHLLIFLICWYLIESMMPCV